MLGMSSPYDKEEVSSTSDSSIGSHGIKARQRLSNLKDKAKVKVQKLKNRAGHGGPNPQDAETHEALEDIQNNPAFDPEQVQETLQEHHETFQSKVDRTGTKLERAFDAIVHPQQSARAKVGRETASALAAVPGSQPMNHEEENLLGAQDHLDDAKGDLAADGVLHEDHHKGSYALDRVMDLEEHRDKMKAGYAMTHVNRVRVVKDDKHPWPRWQEFMRTDANTGKQKMDWKEYLGNVAIYQYQSFGAQYLEDTEEEHPFEADVLRSHLERLAMVTAPWQAWSMDVRSVYRWENPARTTRWLLIYLFLWLTQHIVLAIVGWIIWSTVRNRFIPASTNELRQSMQRAADSETAAWHLGELLDKHKSDDWLDEVSKSLGPDLQLLMGDIADLLEVLANFREWKSPKYTAATLVLLSVHVIICCMSWDFTARYLYAVMGLMFFVSWPIQSLHPRYRHAASLIKILLFNIPNHAQWSFGYLRRQALIGQLNVVSSESQAQGDRSDPESKNTVVASVDPKLQGSLASEATDIQDLNLNGSENTVSETSTALLQVLGTKPLISFYATMAGKHGKLILTAAGVHFLRAVSGPMLWKLPFRDMHELRKLDSINKIETKLRALTKNKAVSSGDRLLLQDAHGMETIVQLPRDRDKCFNCIIGFSGLQWQKLQGGAARSADH